jgi:hypothetical protein
VSWPGLPRRRVDQVRATATDATAPGSSSTVRARYVIVSGIGDGVFVYMPGTTPGLGNPPIAWMGGGLVDPYGNVLVAAAGVEGAGTFAVGSYIGITSPGSLPAAPPSGFRFYANSNGTPNSVLTSGLAGNIPLVQIDVNPHNVGNTAAAADLTKTWTVNANDGVLGTAYKIQAYAQMVTGQTTAETLTLGVDLNGVKTPLSTLGASFNGSALATDYDIPIELVMEVNSNGSDAPRITLSGPLGDTSANRLSTNSANMSGHSDVLAWNPGANNTIAVYAQWGGAGGSQQNISTVSSRFYREGT